ncbi:MAG: monovalent cation/H(+) antiporter subunit G [Gammaproteobacteria bacterium]|nr:monovalent cation/H(+) antiporter subunit G [Gammaproteobacteria bacterium]
MNLPVNDIIGNLLLVTGSLFLFSAGLGVLRMPDTYNRIQTGTKATTLGTILVLIGLAFLHPAWTLKLIILIFFVMLTNPVSSHALARAAHTIGIFETDSTVIDQLASTNKGTANNGNDDKAETDEDTLDDNSISKEAAK